jgi:ABC-type lipoprotein export system ATPase subunit
MKAHRIGLSFPSPNHQHKVVFHGLSFVLPTKGLVVITGDSGVGKTSLLSMISGQKKPTKGSLIIPKSWKKTPPVYLEDQLSLVASWHMSDFIFQPETNDYLDQLGLPFHARKKRFQELSGGQKIRVMVALFFSQASACYLLDEPTHALDEELRMRMISFLTNQANHRLIVVATHDLDLIAQANHELNMHSAYESKWKDHQFNAGTFNSEFKITDKLMIKHWLRKLFWLHRCHWLGLVLSVASMLIHVGLLFTGLIQHSLVHQSRRYLEMEKLEPFLAIQEVQQTDIHQSPFQLIKSQAPDLQQLSLAISMIPDARVMTSIAEWFPRSIAIQDVTFDLRFIDLPYQQGQISVMWIYPEISLPTYFELSSPIFMETIPSFSYGRELTIIDKRPIQSWFEPPQILLSYWQWLHLLQSKTATVNGEEKSFLSIFQTLHPPSSVLVHDPSGTVKDILTSNPNHHDWTLQQSLEKTYELNNLLLDSTRTLTQFIFMGLWILGLFIWSTRLHWIYQNHHSQWRWLLLLHVPMRRIWKAISSKTFLSGFMTLGIVQLVFIFLMNNWRFVPGYTLMSLLVVGFLIYLVQQISRYLILHWYGYA